ncbi:NAD(P)-dependent oxidoreductase [Actinomadura meridiana]|uniref:NAD(P)-dependent oxidoreductase n=1 Tax=Actinomadura meridiana TaxID=559626 RepID=A0ABP8BVL4_9ACTN
MRPDTGLSVVVLGGTGFLGRHIHAAFAARGARVHPVSRTAPLCLDLLTTPPDELANLVEQTGADVVVNAAGRAWRSNEKEMAAGNAELVERLIAALSGNPIRLVQLGSVHEYGAGAQDAATSEDHEPAPVTPYGRTKLQATQAVLHATSERNVDGVVLRLANVIGPGVPEGSLFGRVAADLAEAARAGKAAELRLPPLRAARDLVDVGDAVTSVIAAATAPSHAVTGRVINVGRGEAVPMRDLIHRMVALSGLEIPIVEDAEGPPSRTDVAWQCLDIARAERLLGWRPRRTLDDSLRDLLAHVLPAEHPPLGVTTNTH